MSDQHPRPRHGKTRDDRLPVSERTRGGRKSKDRHGKQKEND